MTRRLAALTCLTTLFIAGACGARRGGGDTRASRNGADQHPRRHPDVRGAVGARRAGQRPAPHPPARDVEVADGPPGHRREPLPDRVRRRGSAPRLVGEGTARPPVRPRQQGARDPAPAAAAVSGVQVRLRGRGHVLHQGRRRRDRLHARVHRRPDLGDGRLPLRPRAPHDADAALPPAGSRAP